jgi:DNA-binding CsgD family transcriptional regulator
MLVEPGRIFAEAGPAFQVVVRVYRQLLLAHAGELDEVRKQVTTNPPWAARKSRLDIGALPRWCALVEIGDLIGAPALVEQPYQALSQAVEQGVVFSTDWPFLLQRILGVAAALHHWWDKAEAHFQAAIETATTLGARPELGRSCLDYARTLATRKGKGDRDRITELIKQAHALFHELGMEPFARRATQLAETLQPPVVLAPQQGGVYPDNLDDLEVEILGHIARGRTDQEIVDALVLSRKTVIQSVGNIFAKTGVSERQAAAAYAVERGFVSQAQARGVESASVRGESQGETGNIFRREGDYWILAYQGTVCRLKDSKGLHYIAFLLHSPGREFHTIDIVTATSKAQATSPMPNPSTLSEGEIAAHGLSIGKLGDAGELLDAQAKAAYKRRLNDLRGELEEAQRFNDPTRAAKIQAEVEFLADELAAAVGTGGRDRKAASVAERARVNVTKAIKVALHHIEQNHSVLGRHLATSIKTGMFCSYFPDPTRPMAWIL